ncbi:LOW QUALITY PROTEIN: hypothetical protein PHMEG_00029377 [Phytophthora megakarya]|uniref:Uncharacterized protein n=1 Tax=Phytophthora megakarya TaxID=4795 RepID=A0A225V179_9STRA|nr:LOW QUALITY PROTEIN: hypothetical protein PHMEG_00029377 [Phytophthora megakarya]
MSSHALQRGEAAYANASLKLAIQWISTRGAWLLESLTKAFANIGTTSREDQSVSKVIAGYPAPDLPHQLIAGEFGQLLTLRNELYQHVLGSLDPRLNVATDFVNASFAALLMHLKPVLEDTARNITTPAHLCRYLYELERGITATNNVLGCSISIQTCCEWGFHRNARWRTMNHAQLSTTINDRIARVEAIVGTSAGLTTPHAEMLSAVQVAPASLVSSSAVVAPSAASTLAGCFLNWYMHRIWETVPGKKSKISVQAAVNIMKVLYQAPCEIPPPPDRSDKTANATWKHALWTLALAMGNITNERLNALDGKKHQPKPRAHTW